MHLNNGGFAYDGFFRYSGVSLYFLVLNRRHTVIVDVVNYKGPNLTELLKFYPEVLLAPLNLLIFLEIF